MDAYIFETVKTKTYHIKPFGNFKFKWKKTRLYNEKLNWVMINECVTDLDEAMPLSDEENDRFVKLMLKHKTDVFVDDNDSSPTFYTRTIAGMTPVSHPRITNVWNERKKINESEK